MPQLPSGRHFAISAESLVELFKRVLNGFRVDELMAIVSVEHLLNHIDVLCFRSAGAATRENTERTAEGSAPLSKGLVSYRSDFTVGSIQAEITTWSKKDRDAFLAFFELESTRTQFQVVARKCAKGKT